MSEQDKQERLKSFVTDVQTKCVKILNETMLYANDKEYSDEVYALCMLEFIGKLLDDNIEALKSIGVKNIK